MRTLCTLLFLWTLGSGLAQAAEDATVLVVPVHKHAGPAFKQAVVRLLSQPLRDRVDVLPAPAFASTAKRLRLAATALHTAAGLRRLGRGAGATHVLLVEAVGRRPRLAANVTLIQVKTGQVLSSQHYRLPGGILTPALANKMLAPVRAKLAGPAAAPGRVAAAKDDDLGVARDEPLVGEDPTEATTLDPSLLAEEADAPGIDSTIYTRASVIEHMRAPLRLSLGVLFLQREAHLQGTGVPVQNAPCYCSTRSNQNPFFPAAQLGLEFYPGALVGFGDWRGDLGLQADLGLTAVKTRYDQSNPSQTITSTVAQLRVGPSYRHIFGSASSWQPILQLGLGYSMFSFPLSQGPFPGVRYSGPFLAGLGILPLGIPQLGLLVGATLLPWTGVGGGASPLLTNQISGFGYQVDGSLRFAFGRFETQLGLRYQNYSAKFGGIASLPIPASAPRIVPQPQLTDSLLQFLLNFAVVI